MLQVITEHLLTGYRTSEIKSMSNCMLEEVYEKAHEMGYEFEIGTDGREFDNPWDLIVLDLEIELRKRNLIH